jgi:hypothetical protein
MTLSPAVGCLAVCPRLFGGPPERMFCLRRDTPDKRLFRFPAVASPARVSFNYSWPSAIVFAPALLTLLLGSAGSFIL